MLESLIAVPSIANVLRLRRPMVIVDEARTNLSFDTLARLNPALIFEFTATPVTPEEHKPEKGIYASNVLHHVSAAELKAANMIKLPVILCGRSDPKETIGNADCAVYLECCKELKAWVRNTVRQPNSFWLQTSSDRFYPDFIGLLNDGRVLVVEYKGAHIATADDAKEKQRIGELWAD